MLERILQRNVYHLQRQQPVYERFLQPIERMRLYEQYQLMQRQQRLHVQRPMLERLLQRNGYHLQRQQRLYE
jgi:hypothetical protein